MLRHARRRWRRSWPRQRRRRRCSRRRRPRRSAWPRPWRTAWPRRGSGHARAAPALRGPEAAQAAAVDAALAEARSRLALLPSEASPSGGVGEALGEARAHLDALKSRCVVARSALESEREKSTGLERAVAELRERLSSMGRLREQKAEATAAQRALWDAQVQAGRSEAAAARDALDALQAEFFSACAPRRGVVPAGPYGVAAARGGVQGDPKPLHPEPGP